MSDANLAKLQRYGTQQSPDRIVTSTRKHDHITPVLNELHWLPVRERGYIKQQF